MQQPPLINRIIINIKKALGMNVVLCAGCKWNWRSACHNRERPHAVYCKEYEKK